MYRLFGFLLTAAVMVATASIAQEDWPQEVEILEQGTPIDTQAIEALLARNSVIITFGEEVYGQGLVLDCRSADSAVLSFNGVASTRDDGASCFAKDSRLCFRKAEGTFCVEPRDLPGWDSPFIAVWGMIQTD